jgi:hypothetical protein
MMTPANPSDTDWHKIGKTVREIVAGYLHGIRLRSVEMPCAIANATMGAAELIAN